MRRFFALLLLGVVSACSLRDTACAKKPSPQAQQNASQINAATTGERRPIKILFLGDSITAGYGLNTDQAYPTALQEKFNAEGYADVEAVNAGVSGDTTAGGLRRLDQILESDIRVVVVALGGNDALRGLTTMQTHDNLAGIISKALERNYEVMLVGMEAPTNLGPDYRESFRNVYINLLREYQGRISFVPFLLEGVAGNPSLNQADGVHPTAEGAKIVAQTIYPKLRDLVDRIG